MFNLIYLFKERALINKELDSLVFGSVEIRDINGNKKIYIHKREGKSTASKYLGEYSKGLEDLIKSNNLKAKDLKKRLHLINDDLKSLGLYKRDIDKDDVRLSITLARRYLVDSIYKQAILEGVSTTYSMTENILSGGTVGDMSVNDVRKITNLKDAWNFILDEDVLSCPTNFAILSEINKYVEASFSYFAGLLRFSDVKVSGCNYLPPLPNLNDVKNSIDSIVSQNKDDIDIAIDLTLFAMKLQGFYDGNKRTAVIFANHYLISHGKGLLVIPAELAEDYKKLLVDYYETDNKEAIRSFLKDYCYIEAK